MGNRSVLEFLLKLINLLLTISGVSMLILGVYCLIKWVQNSHKNHLDPEGESSRFSLVVDHLKYDFDKLPSAWFILLFLAIGTMLFLTFCLGCLGTAARKPCCLSFYSVLLFGLLLAEVVVAAFLIFNQNLSEDMLNVKKRGNSYSVYHFIHVNWKIVRWVVLTALVLEVIALVLALYLRSLNRAVYDSSDDEIIVSPGSQQATTDKRRNPANGNSMPAGNIHENLVII